MTERWAVVSLSLIVLYLTLFYRLGHLPFVGSDEPRYARIAEEMNLSGQYVTPTLNRVPWLEKPPLLFWLEAASFRLFGVSEWAARLPVALLAAATLLASSFLAYRMAGPPAAVLAFLILSTSGLFYTYARAASTDMPLVAMLSLALIAAQLGSHSSKALWGALSGLALGLAVLAKGPVALVLFSGILGVHCLILQRYPWNWRQTLLGVLGFFGLALPWFWLVWLENGYDFVATFWLNHHLARFLTGLHHHVQPFWYFLPVVLIGFFPWVVFLATSVARLWELRLQPKHEKDRMILFLWLWVLVPLLFFSLSQSKLAGYALPIFPALALLAALEWDRVLSGGGVGPWVMKFQLVSLAVLAVGISIVLPLGFHLAYASTRVGLYLSFPFLACLLWGLQQWRQGHAIQLFLSLVVGMTILAGLSYWKAAPVVASYHSARALALRAGPLISDTEPLVLYRYFHHTATYYTGYRTTREAIPDPGSLHSYLSAHSQHKYTILTQQEGWRDLESKFNPLLVAHKGNLYLAQIER
ncbi:MAG: ArnT family glycosyltransferase [Acidobacteriota bacterium]